MAGRGLAGRSLGRQGRVRRGLAGQLTAGTVGKAGHGLAGRGTAGNTTNRGHLPPFTHDSPMTKPIYGIKPGSWSTKSVTAQSIGETFEKIRSENGSDIFTAQQVVDEARPENHPIHPCFEWDDWEAAEAYRRDQARSLIRRIEVQYPDTEQTEPAFVHVKVLSPDGKQNQVGYAPVRLAVERPDMLASALAELRNNIAGLARTAMALEKMARQQQSPDLEKVSNARVHLDRALVGAG
jgi:hypothetical protein